MENKSVYIPFGVEKVEHIITDASNFLDGGNTTHFNISYDASLGEDGKAYADAILKVCEADYATLQSYFGNIIPPDLPFNVRITSDSDGAKHSSCGDVNIDIGGNSAGGLNTAFISSLLIAEEDEVFEAAFGHGWDCGASNGEGLSRVLANDMYKGAEPPNFISAHVWLDTPGRPDFITKTDPSDGNYISIGCSVLFLNWLRFQLNYSWSDIIQAGAETLAQTYTNLTGRTDAFTRFLNLINGYFPEGTISNLATDNPFPLPAAPPESGIISAIAPLLLTDESSGSTGATSTLLLQ